MTFDDVDYLAALWEHRHVGRAAQSLGLTQPALSRALARFETRLGMPLFERHPKGLIPTAAGEAYVRRMLRIRIELGDALSELDRMRSGKLGALRVGYSPSVDEALVLGACRRLVTERPAAHVTIVSRLMQDLHRFLVHGELDVIVAPVPAPAVTDLESVALYEDRLQIVADRRHPLLRRAVVTLADVAAQAWVLQPTQFRMRRMLDALVAEAGHPPLNVRIESDVAGLGRLALLRGTRMLSLHSDRDGDALERLGLRPVVVPGVVLDRRVALMRRMRGYVSPLSERFGELLRLESETAADDSRRAQ